MTNLEASGPPQASRSAGTARRRREQAKRALSRHIAWSLGLAQAHCSHHTAGGFDLVQLVQAVRSDLAKVQEENRHLKAHLEALSRRVQSQEASTRATPQGMHTDGEAQGVGGGK